MARRWIGVVLLAGWLGVSATARAQYPVVPASGDVPPHANDDIPPHGAPPGPASGPAPAPAPAPAPGGPQMCPPPPPVDGPMPHPEVVPDNGFSNVHPEQARPSPHFYLGVDYLQWWTARARFPLLATTGSLNDAVPGAFGQSGTKPLIGDEGFGAPSTPGVRVTAYYWFDQDHTLGLDASGFIVDQAERTATVGGGGDPNGTLIARPFYNPNAGAFDADPVNVPGVMGGILSVDLKRNFWGGDADLRCSSCVDFGPFTRVSFLAGGRFLYLSENLLISESAHDVPDVLNNPGNTYLLHDNFQTFNRFYGAQFGVETESRVGPLVLTLAGKVAFGVTEQTAKNGGDSTVHEPDGTVTTDVTRGLLVQPSNLGRFGRDRFAVVPVVSANLAWEFNEHLRISVGYDFLWWSSVVRPGDQIDGVVNVGAVGDQGQLGTVTRPQMPFRPVGFWAQGISAGLLVSY
jgi:hypothetical protein